MIDVEVSGKKITVACKGCTLSVKTEGDSVRLVHQWACPQRKPSPRADW